MARLSINGYVIRGLSTGESSRVISLLTDNQGKLKGIAKGARKSASAKGGALELFSLIRCDIYLKENAELGTLGSVELIDDHSTITGDPVHFGYSSAFCEIIDKLTILNQPMPELFNLCGQYFRVMSGAGQFQASVIFWAALLKTLTIIGYQPHLFECVVCGKVNDGKAAYYDPQQGGIICSNDVQEHIQYGKLSAESMRLLQQFIEKPLDQLSGIVCAEKTLGDIEQFIMSFADYHTGLRRNLKSFKFLSQLKVK